MRILVVVFIFLIIPIHASTTATKSQTQQNQMTIVPKEPPQIINIYNNLNQQGTNQQSQTSTNTNIVQTNISIQITNTMNYVINVVKTEGKKYQQSIISYVTKNKKKVLCSIIVACYVGLFVYCSLLNRFLSDHAKWHYWKHEIPIDDLPFEDTQRIFEELLMAMNQHYFNQYDPTNNLRPLIIFYNDISKEIAKINRYITIMQGLNSVYIMSLFPISKKRIKKAQEKVRRLEYIKKLFVNHIALHNISVYAQAPDKLMHKQYKKEIVPPAPPITRTLLFVPPQP